MRGTPSAGSASQATNGLQVQNRALPLWSRVSLWKALNKRTGDGHRADLAVVMLRSGLRAGASTKTANSPPPPPPPPPPRQERAHLPASRCNDVTRRLDGGGTSGRADPQLPERGGRASGLYAEESRECSGAARVTGKGCRGRAGHSRSVGAADVRDEEEPWPATGPGSSSGSAATARSRAGGCDKEDRVGSGVRGQVAELTCRAAGGDGV